MTPTVKVITLKLKIGNRKGKKKGKGRTYYDAPPLRIDLDEGKGRNGKEGTKRKEWTGRNEREGL